MQSQSITKLFLSINGAVVIFESGMVKVHSHFSPALMLKTTKP